MTVIGYVRISDAQKQDPGSQLQLMVDQGIVMKDVFVDMGSGSIPPKEREAFARLINRLKVGDVDEVVFSEYSRIGRGIVESLGAVLDILRDFKGVKMRSLSNAEKGINSYPQDIQLVLIMFAMSAAQKEREHIMERTRWGMANAKANGTRSGRPIGRPPARVDFPAVEKVMRDYKLKEAQAVRVLGYKMSTFYKAKRERRENK